MDEIERYARIQLALTPYIGAESYADSPDHPLCGALSGDPVPRSGYRSGLENLPEALSDRGRIICILAGQIPQKRGSISNKPTFRQPLKGW